jgi:O-acetyl-ADP-ribose deacetylase (regulator of RNase III)
MKVVTGDITKVQDIEVIVNAANGCGIMGAGVAGAINRSSSGFVGEEAREVCRDNVREPGTMYITGSGYLKRRGIQQVYHAVVMKFPGSPTSLDIVVAALRSVMAAAIEKGVKSIAIPGLGTGIGGLDKQQVAQRMAKILQQYEGKIDITVIDQGEEFVEEFSKFVGQKVEEKNE